MKERPILFSAPMVRAILDGSKTQTRRLVKPQPSIDSGWEEEPGWALSWRGHDDGLTPAEFAKLSPFGQPGDRLYVRETWADLEALSDGNFQRQAIYRADDIERYGDEDEFVDVTAPDMRWRPSIHMPRWASRILLEVVGVRVERLQDISEADAAAEGVRKFTEDFVRGIPGWLGYEEALPRPNATSAYVDLWEHINGAGSWDVNPWVWVVEFRRIEEGAPRAQEA